MANLEDVAREAGVSLASASHALSGSRPVSDDVGRRVRAAAERVGYVPHRSAQALRTGRSRTLGVVVPDLTNPFFPALVQAIESAAREAGYGLLVADSHSGVDGERDALDLLASHRVEGIVWIPAGPPGAPPELPTVTLDRPVAGRDAVLADHRAAGRAVAEHLLAVGRARPVLLTGPLDVPSARERREGFLSSWTGEIAFEAAVAFRHELPEAVRERLEDPSHGFDAVVAANDAVAVGVLRALRAAGVDVPGAVAVIGVDDVPWAELLEPALTTVRQPVRALGREAVQLLLRRIERPEDPPRRVVLPVRLVVRDSSPPTRTVPSGSDASKPGGTGEDPRSLAGQAASPAGTEEREER